MGIELTTDHHWSDVYSTVLNRHVVNGRSLNWILFHAPILFFGIGSFLDSIEHNFIRIWKSETGKAWQISTVGYVIYENLF